MISFSRQEKLHIPVLLPSLTMGHSASLNLIKSQPPSEDYGNLDYNLQKSC